MGAGGIISRQQSDAVSYYLKNAHGDIVYTLNDSRTKTATYKYSAWGETMDEYDSNTSSPNPIKYSGEYEDSESGMIYLRGRYYDPELRRFITEDPAKDGLNWYAYCGNNPVMYVDPWGLADVPENGTDILIEIISKAMTIINCELTEMEGEDVLADSIARGMRSKLSEKEDEIAEFSENLSDLVNNVIVSGQGTIQQISSVIALCIEMKKEIIDRNLLAGEEVISEEKVIEKYNYYVKTGDIFISEKQGGSIVERVLPDVKYVLPNQHTFTGNSELLGYWVRIIYYDVYTNGQGDFYNVDSEDLPYQINN